MLHANDERQAWPSVTTIANETRLNRDTVRRALRLLEAAGEIHLEAATTGGAYVYRLTYDPALTPRTGRARTGRGGAASAGAASAGPAASAVAARGVGRVRARTGRAKVLKASNNYEDATRSSNGATTDERGTHLPGTGWIRDHDATA